MGIFFVYHKIVPDFIHEPDRVNRRDYQYVATVVTDDDVVDGLEDVFRITNNIDGDWRENPEVKKTANKKGFRSTSVGDVVVEAMGLNTLETNMKTHLVCGCGFKEVEWYTGEEVTT